MNAPEINICEKTTTTFEISSLSKISPEELYEAALIMQKENLMEVADE